MITLSLLKYLEENGFGIIDVDLFWQKLALGNDGLYITELGNSSERNQCTSTIYEIYSRGSSDTEEYKKLQEVASFLNHSYGVCKLPAVPPIFSEGYDGVTIMPVSTITNVGEDIGGRVIYSITGKIYFRPHVYAQPSVYQYIAAENGAILSTENNNLLITETING